MAFNVFSFKGYCLTRRNFAPSFNNTTVGVADLARLDISSAPMVALTCSRSQVVLDLLPCVLGSAAAAGALRNFRVELITIIGVSQVRKLFEHLI